MISDYYFSEKFSFENANVIYTECSSEAHFRRQSVISCFANNAHLPNEEANENVHTTQDDARNKKKMHKTLHGTNVSRSTIF